MELSRSLCLNLGITCTSVEEIISITHKERLVDRHFIDKGLRVDGPLEDFIMVGLRRHLEFDGKSVKRGPDMAPVAFINPHAGLFMNPARGSAVYLVLMRVIESLATHGEPTHSGRQRESEWEDRVRWRLRQGRLAAYSQWSPSRVLAQVPYRLLVNSEGPFAPSRPIPVKTTLQVAAAW